MDTRRRSRRLLFPTKPASPERTIAAIPKQEKTARREIVESRDPETGVPMIRFDIGPSSIDTRARGISGSTDFDTSHKPKTCLIPIAKLNQSSCWPPATAFTIRRSTQSAARARIVGNFGSDRT